MIYGVGSCVCMRDGAKEVRGLFMSVLDEQPCTRRRVVIGNENFYLLVGADFVMATIPHENRPDNMPLREIVEKLCEVITEMMGGEK